MRRGTWWSQNEEGIHAHAVGVLVVPKRRGPPNPCGGGLDDLKAEEAPIPMRPGPP